MTTPAETAQPPAAPQAVPPVTGGLLARNTVINLAGRILPLLVAVVSMPYVIRHLGPDRYGLLSLAWSVVGYFALFDLGIGSATIKFVAELLGKGETQKLSGLVWTALTSQTLLGIVAGVLLAAATPLLVNRLLKIPPALHAQAHLVFLILAISLPITLAAGSLGGVLAASQRFDLLNAVGVPSSALNYLLPVVALAMGFGLPVIVATLVAARAASLIASFLFCRRLHPALALPRFNRHFVRPLLGFGGWVTVSGAAGGVLLYFDKFLLGSVVSIASVGFYVPAYLIASKLNILSGSFMATLFPAFSTAAGRRDSDWIRNAFVRSLKLLLLTIGPAALALIFFAGPLFRAWLGAKFAAEGSLVLQILAVGVLANSLAFVPYDLLQAIGRPDLVGRLRLAEVPLHVVVAWFLAVHYGLVGVAIAFSFSLSLDFFALVYVVCRATHTRLTHLARKEVACTTAGLAALSLALLALRASAHGWVAQLSLLSLLGASFAATSWRYALDKGEKCNIRQMLLRTP